MANKPNKNCDNCIFDKTMIGVFNIIYLF